MTAVTWIQKILFGPPGCGKSFEVRREAEERLGISGRNCSRMIETTFHPEYGYGDFLAKLLPHSISRQQEYQLSLHGSTADGAAVREVVSTPKIEYRIHVGPLLRALVAAYAQPESNVLLVIDEINRGNCAQIFGDTFQLLDRDEHGWSAYGIELSDLFVAALEQELKKCGSTLDDLPNELRVETAAGDGVVGKLRLPPNLSLIGTMNTSDESVYYMDTAFKRRWDFSYIPWRGDSDNVAYKLHCSSVIEGTDHQWLHFLERLNRFIARRFVGRNVDDKQVGIWFLKGGARLSRATSLAALRERLVALDGVGEWEEWRKVFPRAEKYDKSANLLTKSVKGDFESHGLNWPDVHSNPVFLAAALSDAIDEHMESNALFIPRDDLRNKLMFFLWDNVFSRDRTPLLQLVTTGDGVRTFGDFIAENHVEAFIEAIMKEDGSSVAT